MTHLQPAPPEPWQIELVAAIFAGVVLFAVIGFSALAIARRLDRREETPDVAPAPRAQAIEAEFHRHHVCTEQSCDRLEEV